jgi:hypothetical protein
MRTAAEVNRVTLRIEGSRAVSGVGLSDFESFIKHFLRALRVFHRSLRREPAKKPGRPDRHEELVTAFRLVRFEPGSGVATIEPIADQAADDAALFDDVPPALSNLRSLTSAIEEERALSEDVIDALDRARRTAGDDGSIDLLLPGDGVRQTRIDKETIDSLPRTTVSAPAEVTSVSGRLHLIDLEPDRIAIRASDGVEWECRYPEEFEDEVRRLIGEIVRASGKGRLTTPQRGRMELDRIEPAMSGEQTTLFTREPIPMSELLERSGITGPQGLDALASEDWVGDDADEAYLAAMLGHDDR